MTPGRNCSESRFPRVFIYLQNSKKVSLKRIQCPWEKEATFEIASACTFLRFLWDAVYQTFPLFISAVPPLVFPKKNSMIPKLFVSVHSVIFQTSLLGKSDEDKNEYISEAKIYVEWYESLGIRIMQIFVENSSTRFGSRATL